MPDWNSLATPHTLELNDFVFSNGNKDHIKLHCRTLGTLNQAKDNAVLLLHGTTGSSVQFLQPGMGDALFDSGQPLDHSKYFLIMPDAIGHGESSKPSTANGTSFPQYSYTDIVKAQHRVVQDLFGLQQLRLILGTSMGGMNTWMWGYLYPRNAQSPDARCLSPSEACGTKSPVSPNDAGHDRSLCRATGQ